MIVNLWRPLATVRNWGLGVLDGRSLAQGDVHPSTMISFDNSPGGRTRGVLGGRSAVVDTAGREARRRTPRRPRISGGCRSSLLSSPRRQVPVRHGETTTPLHAPSHRWVYFPRMAPDECLLLKIFDSRSEPGAPPHTSRLRVDSPRPAALGHRGEPKASLHGGLGSHPTRDMQIPHLQGQV